MNGKEDIEWIPFKVRELTDEEKKIYPELCFIFDCPLPEDGQEILVSRNGDVFIDTFYDDESGCLDSGLMIDNGMAWMPKPKPYSPKEEHN